uniref:Uncharacterized protein n=1 Tax=Daphnia galeata TaxID=27404 RepID=A0A8J2S1H0_9CRUS|nr:unnamed protein product [Daphnia galeata]
MTDPMHLHSQDPSCGHFEDDEAYFNKLMVPRCQSHPSMFENHLHHLEVKRFDGHQYCRLRGCHQT